jgi:hypothetical protein
VDVDQLSPDEEGIVSDKPLERSIRLGQALEIVKDEDSELLNRLADLASRKTSDSF